MGILDRSVVVLCVFAGICLALDKESALGEMQHRQLSYTKKLAGIEAAAGPFLFPEFITVPRRYGRRIVREYQNKP